MTLIEKIKHFFAEKWIGLVLFFGTLLLTALFGYFYDIDTSTHIPNYGVISIRNPFTMSPEDRINKALGINNNMTPSEKDAAIQQVIDRLTQQHKQNPEKTIIKPLTPKAETNKISATLNRKPKL